MWPCKLQANSRQDSTGTALSSGASHSGTPWGIPDPPKPVLRALISSTCWRESSGDGHVTERRTWESTHSDTAFPALLGRGTFLCIWDRPSTRLPAPSPGSRTGPSPAHSHKAPHSHLGSSQRWERSWINSNMNRGPTDSWSKAKIKSRIHPLL